MKTTNSKTKKTVEKSKSLKPKQTGQKVEKEKTIPPENSLNNDGLGSEKEGELNVFLKTIRPEQVLPILLTTKLLVLLFGKSERYCSDLLKEIAKAVGKTPKQLLTINDLCKSNKIDYEEVIFALFFKEKYLNEFAKNYMEQHRYAEIAKLENEKNALQEKWKTEYLLALTAEMKEVIKMEVRKEMEKEMEERKKKK